MCLVKKKGLKIKKEKCVSQRAIWKRISKNMMQRKKVILEKENLNKK